MTLADPVAAALQAAFPEEPDASPPVHDKCGQPYERFNLSGHLQTCPNRPTSEDLCRFIEDILETGRLRLDAQANPGRVWESPSGRRMVWTGTEWVDAS